MFNSTRLLKCRLLFSIAKMLYHAISTVKVCLSSLASTALYFLPRPLFFYSSFTPWLTGKYIFGTIVHRFCLYTSLHFNARSSKFLVIHDSIFISYHILTFFHLSSLVISRFIFRKFSSLVSISSLMVYVKGQISTLYFMFLGTICIFSIHNIFSCLNLFSILSFRIFCLIIIINIIIMCFMNCYVSAIISL